MKERKEELASIIKNTELPVADRKEAYQESLSLVLNPFPQFDPKTFDPYQGTPDHDVKRRERVLPPRILPTAGMLPKQIMEGQMIGMYESKQDLYLLIAWLSRRVTELEDAQIKKVDSPDPVKDSV